MPTFNKSRGFKLKSGNTIPFKEMGSSPVKQGQADASLVAAAKAAAMANVPKDLSAQYNQAANAAITANKAKTDFITDVVNVAADTSEKVVKGAQDKKKQKQKQAKKEQKRIDKEQDPKNKLKKLKAQRELDKLENEDSIDKGSDPGAGAIYDAGNSGASEDE